MVKQVHKEKISITVEPDVYQSIKDAADKDDRSVSSMINKILKDWVKDQGEK